ncbi:MAG: RICIN domain-containing protein [Pseudomonadota bacterium]
MAKNHLKDQKSATPTVMRISALLIGSLISCVSYASNCTDLPKSGKTYKIINEASGMALDVSGKSKKDGADVIQWTDNNQTNQQWTLSNLGDGTWTIRPVHSNKSLDVSGWSTQDDTPIKQWSYSGYANQQWKLTQTSTGSFMIESAHSGKFVTAANKDKGALIRQNPDLSSAAQRWYLNPTDGACTNKSFMGSNKVLIGSINSASAKTAPFDAQYQYINNVAPVDACMTSCKADNACGKWWGCWQWNERPPGSQYPGDFIENLGKLTYDNKPHPQLSYWTYYSIRHLVGGAEGQEEIDALNNSDIMKRYFNDYRFFLQKVGTNRTILHIEPDLWGFIRSTNRDPNTIPAKVNESNPDCPAKTHANTVSGYARCMITMARKYAPNSAVGLHTSPWNYEANGDAEKVAKFMSALGASEGDFIATDPSDRDAGYYSSVLGQHFRWWDEQKFAAYLSWSKTLSETLGKPTIMWQIPVGNSWQDNTYQHYKDNRVELLFSKIDDVAAAHVVGLMFGPGDTPQTNIDTDGGMLIQKTINYWKSGGAQIR